VLADGGSSDESRDENETCPPVVVEDLEAVDIKDADDRLSTGGYDRCPLHLDRFVDTMNHRRKHSIVNSLPQPCMVNVSRTDRQTDRQTCCTPLSSTSVFLLHLLLKTDYNTN